MDCNIWAWLNLNAGALGVIAAFALAVVTSVYVVLMANNVKATRNMVEEMKSERTKRNLKASVFCSVKYGNYRSWDEQLKDFVKITQQPPQDIIFALQELDLEDRVGLVPGDLVWRVRLH